MKEGKVRAAKHVDHIVDIADGGAMYDLDNLQPLCIPCHSRKTASKTTFSR